MVTRKGSEREAKENDTEKFHFKMLITYRRELGILESSSQYLMLVHNKDLSMKEFFLVLLYNISLATDLVSKYLPDGLVLKD